MSVEADLCPFCASENAQDMAIREGYIVRCMDCGATGPPCFKGEGDMATAQQRAIAAWNRRADQPQPLSTEDEAKLAVKARELVAAVDDVVRIIALPALARAAQETKALLSGWGDQP